MRRPPTPCTAAIRAVHQYRCRDVVPYLALRYYLTARSARRERWAADVAVSLVLQRTSSPYLAVKHFKERCPDGTIRLRDIFLPCANEALAEAALLAECAKHESFANPSQVFSYALAVGAETNGAFRPYFQGLQRRHLMVAAACRSHPHSVVRYCDIRAFYASIPASIAADAWRRACERALLPGVLSSLGRCLLDSHRAFGARDGSAVLTGPMFSHLVGNLVLRELDLAMSKESGVTYARYVDDIILVGSPAAVDQAHAEVCRLLQEIGLALHPAGSGKDLSVSGREWLAGEHDFDDSDRPVQWKRLVGPLKWLLVSAPEQHSTVYWAMRRAGFRMPIADYTGAIRDAGYLNRLGTLVRLRWLRGRQRGVGDLIRDARVLRDRYLRESDLLLAQVQEARGYRRKRVVPKLRYRAGRLAYLAAPNQLAQLAERLRLVPELALHAAVLLAIATRDVTDVVCLGTSAAQAVGQALHAEGHGATLRGPLTCQHQAQGLAVLALNGVPVSGGEVDRSAFGRDELLQLARGGATPELMRSADPFIREFASLHGLTTRPRHADTLDTAFDEAEDAAFDATSQLVASASGC